MRKATLIAISLAAVAAQAQDGWKNPKTVFATFVEKYAEGPERRLDLLQQDGLISYRTDAPIAGELSGIKRMEAVGPNGIFTWIEGKPKVAIQLLSPTLLDASDYFDRPRFSRADLEFNVAGIEKALNRKVYVGKQEAIAGRDCLVLRVAANASTSATDYQKLWIDRETGLAMKQVDSFGGKITYEREVKSIAFQANEATADFEMAHDATIIRGLVSPATLLKMNALGGTQQFITDIKAINGAVKDPQKPWAGFFDSAISMGYAGTVSRELRVQTVSMNNSQNSNTRNQRGQNQRRQNQFGRRQQEGGDRIITFQQQSSEGGPTAATVVRISRAEIAIAEEAAVAADGTPLNQSGSNSNNVANSSKTYPFAQSDFVDSKTGDTLSLLQVTGGRPIESVMGALLLGQGTAIENEKQLEAAKVYDVVAPVKLRILVWKNADTAYALASTNLSNDELIALARKVKKA